MKPIFAILFLLSTFCLFAQVDVTFQVDMSGQTISPDGVHIAGSMNSWNTSSHPLTDQGNNIYAVTINLPSGGDFEYKFLNGNVWGTEESAPSTCTVGSNNRVFTSPQSATTLAVVPFNGCAVPTETQTVTFRVDMNGETVSGNGVHVTGLFNGWSPNQSPMTNAGNNIYEATVTVLSSLTNLQYKFINGNAWGMEEVVPAPCVNSNSNREFNLGLAGATVELTTYVFGSCAEGLAVPVELTYFKGAKVADGIMLTWQTASEENNAGFEVERSKDGRNWQTIDFVKGYGQSVEIKNYLYVDHQPLEEANYYQLKQIDFDGQFEYSKVVSVQLKASNIAVNVYPNPVLNTLNIENAYGQVTLYNLLGQSVKRLQLTDQFYQLDTSDLVNGTYLLLIEATDGSIFQSVIVK